MSKYARKKDNNHNEIQQALTAAGTRCVDCSRFGDGFPDILVEVRGRFILLEVKQGKADLTDAERVMHAFLAHGPIHVVRTVDEALDACGLEAYRFGGEGVA